MTTKRKKGKYQHKDVYLNAAFEIIQEQGIEKLTMRRLAEYLDVSAMAIYKHYPSKDELLKALLDAFVLRADVLPADDLSWPDFIAHVSRQMFDALRSDPIWLTLLGAMDISANALQVTQAFLAKLTAAGFDAMAAMEAYVATLQLVMGSVVLESAIANRRKSLTTVLQGVEGLADSPLQELVNRPQLETGLPLLLDALQLRLQQNPPRKT